MKKGIGVQGSGIKTGIRVQGSGIRENREQETGTWEGSIELATKAWSCL
jgi:hypothetical protein